MNKPSLRVVREDVKKRGEEKRRKGLMNKQCCVRVTCVEAVIGTLNMPTGCSVQY